MCIGLLCIPAFESRKKAHESTCSSRGCIVSVNDSDLHRYNIVLTGDQILSVEIVSGPYAGTRVETVNHLFGKLEVDEYYKVGESVLLEYSIKDNKPIHAYARGHYRLGLELILVILFTGILCVIAGWTGVKAIVSFAFTALAIWKVMIPCFLLGYDPIAIGAGVVVAMTAVISFLVGGMNRKGLTTFAGAFSGLMITGIFAWLFTGGLRIHGAVRPFAETLLYSGYGHLNLTRIFIAGVFIAASGAVMDLAMDIAASMDELKKKKPTITLREHITSGMNVGRSVIGTMTTTLLLAYSGSYIVTIMYFTAENVPLGTMLNIRFIAAEILDIMVGSFGLVTVAPFTALAGGVIYHIRKDECPNE